MTKSPNGAFLSTLSRRKATHDCISEKTALYSTNMFGQGWCKTDNDIELSDSEVASVYRWYLRYRIVLFLRVRDGMKYQSFWSMTSCIYQLLCDIYFHLFSGILYGIFLCSGCERMHLEDGGSKLLRNGVYSLPNYTTSCTKKNLHLYQHCFENLKSWTTFSSCLFRLSQLSLYWTPKLIIWSQLNKFRNFKPHLLRCQF
jgi:hypothetical protein